jgi:hypothetical protein
LWRLWSGKQRFNDVIHPDLAIVQDIAAQTRKGRVVDRANERLGRSDAAIILWRKILTREFRAIADEMRIEHTRRVLGD